jgi:hydrogenase maturation factor
MLAGTVAKNRLIDKRDIKPGDNVLLTKAVSVEGTAIIAREFGDRLGELGMTESDIETCKKFLFSISILEEAQIARNCAGVSAMHDITEGGLATALMELSIAGEHRIKINMDHIPIFEQTEKICTLLGINPMGLIGSGSLLICSRKNETQTVMDNISDAGINITCIGEVMEPGRGIEAVNKSGPVTWPNFEVDELTRLY